MQRRSGGVAETRTHGFGAPAFAGYAFVDWGTCPYLGGGTGGVNPSLYYGTVAYRWDSACPRIKEITPTFHLRIR